MAAKPVSGFKCDAEIADRARMRLLPKGRLAWKTCRRAAIVTCVTRLGTVLHYCAKHADRAARKGES
jgi:hypothetical protein